MNFHIGSVKVHVSFLFCAELCCMTAFDNGYLLPAFLSVCAHEGAHLLAMLLCRTGVQSVRLEAFGILISKRDEAPGTRRAIRIALAGCAGNFLLFSLCFFGYYWSKNAWLLRMGSINLALGLINLLPVTGLDGGQALQLIVQECSTSKNAVFTPKIISLCACVILFAIGAIIYFKVRQNPSLCVLSFYLFVLTLGKWSVND